MLRGAIIIESVIVCLLAASLLEILGDAISYIVSLLPAGDGLWRRRTNLTVVETFNVSALGPPRVHSTDVRGWSYAWEIRREGASGHATRMVTKATIVTPV